MWLIMTAAVGRRRQKLRRTARNELLNQFVDVSRSTDVMFIGCIGDKLPLASTRLRKRRRVMIAAIDRLRYDAVTLVLRSPGGKASTVSFHTTRNLHLRCPLCSLSEHTEEMFHDKFSLAVTDCPRQLYRRLSMSRSSSTIADNSPLVDLAG